MNGREEHDSIIKEKTFKIIDKHPDILHKYYNSLRGKTEKTKNAYVKYIYDLMEYCNEGSIVNLKRSDIEAYLDSRSVNKKTGNRNGYSVINTRLAAIKGFYEFLVDDEIIDKSPAEKICKLKVLDPKPVVAMTSSEIHLVKKEIMSGSDKLDRDSSEFKWKTRDLAIISLGCSTGLRCSAITEIDIEDIDFNEKSITVIEKGGIERTVYFGENVEQNLKLWIENRKGFARPGVHALFISNRGTRITQDSIYHIISKYTSKLSKHITPHKMRSSCATNLYNKTGDIYLVQEVLGHKNIANTKRYAAVSEEKRRKATEILDRL